MTHARDNLRGIILMVAAMAGFAVEDMFIKWAAADLPTDQRIARSAGLDDPALAALYYQFGRYLLIASSRPGSQAS